MTSRIGIQMPPYPPIQLPPQLPPFIMFPFCAEAKSVASKGTAAATAIPSKVFMKFLQ